MSPSLSPPHDMQWRIQDLLMEGTEMERTPLKLSRAPYKIRLILLTATLPAIQLSVSRRPVPRHCRRPVTQRS